MAHYAKVLDGVVLNVIVAEESFFDTFLDTSPGRWIQTSYNTHGGVHYGADGEPDGGVALRKNYACVGCFYDEQKDAFYDKKPFPSFVLNQDTFLWEPPIPHPDDGKSYLWDEPSVSWVEAT